MYAVSRIYLIYRILVQVLLAVLSVGDAQHRRKRLPPETSRQRIVALQVNCVHFVTQYLRCGDICLAQYRALSVTSANER